VQQPGAKLLGIHHPSLAEPEPEEPRDAIAGAIEAIDAAQREERHDAPHHREGEEAACSEQQQRGEDRAHGGDGTTRVGGGKRQTR
jgi:hypothetical protein